MSDQFPPPPWSGEQAWRDPYEDPDQVPYQAHPGVWRFGPPASSGYRHIPRPRANAEGIDIAAFVLVWVFAPAAIILGYISRGSAKTAGLRPSSLSTAAIVLGWIVTTIGILIPIALYVVGSGAP